MGLVKNQAGARLDLSPKKIDPDEAKTNGCEKQHPVLHATLLRAIQRYHRGHLYSYLTGQSIARATERSAGDSMNLAAESSGRAGTPLPLSSSSTVTCAGRSKMV
jgi:hypothetical protein